ncbi:MAG: radical SAM protein, partial [Candidatus Omnitrophota bacterium]
TEEWKGAIDDFVNMGTPAVVFTGGEPLLRSDLPVLVSYAKKSGLLTDVSTNGLLLEPNMIKQLLDSGLDGINISLDGTTAATHDKIRGVPGVYDRAIAAIKDISSLRKRHNYEISLTVTCVISRLNLNEIIDLVAFVKGLGVDRISFIPIQDASLMIDKKTKAGQLLISDLEKAQGVISQLIIMKKRTSNIDCSIRYLKLFMDSFSGKKRPIACYAAYTTCTLDSYGDIYPCLPSEIISKSVANIKEISLKEGWRSERFNEARRKIKGCRKCYWNCWTELSIMFGHSIN